MLATSVHWYVNTACSWLMQTYTCMYVPSILKWCACSHKCNIFSDLRSSQQARGVVVTLSHFGWLIDSLQVIIACRTC